MGNKELAVALSISEATIKVHLTHIFQKLGLRGRGELAAAYHGLLPLPRRRRRPPGLPNPHSHRHPSRPLAITVLPIVVLHNDVVRRILSR
jgi:hypothetical protein